MTVLGVLSVYLFITAPAPLEDNKVETFTVPIETALKILEEENDAARNLYTKAIVGAGTKQKIKFDENWEEEEVFAGPLPAQFLKLSATALEKSPIQLGLFLGSDYSINQANDFEGEQKENFNYVRKTREAIFFYSADSGRYAYMAPDIASVKPCVTCHNEHDESPKTDWKLNDVMGATTWTYPKQEVGYKELLDMIDALHTAFGFAYETVLNTSKQMTPAPIIGKRWPKDGLFLPSAEVFMKEFSSLSASRTLQTILQATKKEVLKETKTKTAKNDNPV